MNRLPQAGSCLALLVALWGGCGVASDGQPAPLATAVPTLAASATATQAPSAIASAAPAEPAFRSSVAVSVWVRGGIVVDGRGGAPRHADVVIQGDRIVHVGPVEDGLAAETILDATDKLVTPGFIDVHSHADPHANGEALLQQGVTTIVLGQDGRSSAHIGKYLAEFDKRRPVLNVGTLLGHATVRSLAGAAAKPATAAQRQSIEERVGEAMSQGALGVSLGLEYEPGLRADALELQAVARGAAAGDGVVMAHVRNEDDDAILASIDELLAMGQPAAGSEPARPRLHVAHLKIVLGKGAARADAVLARIATARQAGLHVSADVYPYTASYTSLAILFPEGAKTAPDFARQKASAVGALREHLKRRVNGRNGPEAMLFGTGPHAGKTLAAIASQRGIPFEELLLELGPQGGSAAYFVMDEEVMTRFLADPYVMIGTDGGGGGLHPRGHGSFVRVLTQYVGPQQPLSVSEAVRKMSALAAETLRLSDQRGTLVSGKIADLAVFRLSDLKDRASFEFPHRSAQGMSAVLIGGQFALRDGKLTKLRAGRVLRSSPKTAQSKRPPQ